MDVKTTVEIPDDLFREVKQYAARHGIPMREIVERGLALIVRDKTPRAKRFRLRTITTKGEGLVSDGDWGVIRSKIYEGRGG